jgi:hypothetical protein
MVSTKLIRLMAAEKRRKQEREQAAKAARKKASFGVELMSLGHSGEISELRAEITRTQRQLDVLLTERALARGRSFYRS